MTALRSLSVVAAVATLPAFHAVARRFGRPSAFVADLLLAASPFFLTYARQARAYSLAILLVVLTVWAFLRALDTGAARHWTTFVVLAGLALYTQWFAALVLVALYGAALATARTAVVSRRAVAATATLVLLATPILALVVLGDTGGVDWIAPLSRAQLHDLAATLASTHATVGQVAFFGVAAVGLVAALTRCRASRAGGSQPAAAVAATWFVIPTALLVAVSVAKPLLLARYLAVTLPGLALLLALGVGAIVRHRIVLMVAGVGVLSVLGSTGYRPLWARRHADEDWSGIVATVAHQSVTDQAVFVFPPNAEYAVGYYARGIVRLDRQVGLTWPPVPWADPYGRATPSTASALHAAQTVRASVVWLVVRRPVGPTIRATTSNPAALQALERVLTRRFPHHVTLRPFNDHTATLVRYSAGPLRGAVPDPTAARRVALSRQGPSHLVCELREHRIDGPGRPHRADRRLPELPPVDEPSPKQHLHELEVQRAEVVERAELLEVVELPVQHVGLASVRRPVAREAGDQPTSLHQFVLFPPSEEIRCDLRLPVYAASPAPAARRR